MIRVQSPTDQELVQRRRQLLARAAATLDELRQRRASYSLTGSEWEILAELEEIEFLLHA